MKRVLILSVLLLALWPAFSRADDFYETKLNEGLRNSDVYAYLLIKEARENRPEAVKILKRAALYAPDLPAVYFELSKASFSFSYEGFLDSVDYAIQGIDAYSRDFWWSLTLAASLYFSLLLSLVLAFLTIIVFRLVSDLRMISHDTAEMNLHPAFLLLPVAFSVVSPVLFFGAILVLLGLYMKKLDRAVIYVFLAFLFFSPVIAREGSLFVNSISSGAFRAVAAVNGSKDNAYALSVLKSGENDAERFSYALALKREGRYEEAIPILKTLVEKRPDPKSYVNLGNCYVGLYNFSEDRKHYLEEAAKYYQESLKLKPLASAYYNLSQVSRELIDFSHGNEYFTSALALNRNLVSEFSIINARQPNRFVIDETLAPADLWKYARSISKNTFAFGLVSIPLAALPVLCLVLFGFFYWIRMKQSAYRCRKCGMVLCAKCEKRLTWGNLCPQCYGSLVKLDELDVRERVARLLSIYEKQRRRKSILKLLSFVLPGSPQIYAGKVLYGFLLLWPFLFFCLVPVVGSFFITDASFFSHKLLNLFCIAAAAAVYVLANLITRERIAKGWL